MTDTVQPALDPATEVQLVRELRERIHVTLAVDQSSSDGRPLPSTAADERRIRAKVMDELATARLVMPQEMRDRIARLVVSVTVGNGPLDELLHRDGVTEIIINGHDEVMIESDQGLTRHAESFLDEAHLISVIDRLLSSVGRRVDRRSPMADARLPDGSRINVVIPPVAVAGPLVTIRRFRDDLLSVADLAAADHAVADEIRAHVSARSNVLVSGATNAGKTTWLAAAIDAMPAHERVVVVEDAAELPIRHPHAARLEARPAGLDGTGAITIRDLVRNALRMRPDRIVVGEVRGAEAFDLVQALHTGHRGCWSTLHANNATDALERLAVLAATAREGVPLDVLHRQVRAGVDAVVQLERLPDGTRRIADISIVDETDPALASVGGPGGPP